MEDTPVIEYVKLGDLTIEVMLCPYCNGKGEIEPEFWPAYRKAKEENPKLTPRQFLLNSRFKEWYSRVPRKTEPCWCCGSQGYRTYIIR